MFFYCFISHKTIKALYRMEKNDDLGNQLLFTLNSLRRFKSDAVDSLIPEFQNNEYCNLNNVDRFEKLLNYLERSYAASKEVSHLLKESRPIILSVPSLDVLRALLTLASRCEGTTYTKDPVNILGVLVTKEYMNSLSDNYLTSLSKPPLSDRCINQLRLYVDSLPITVQNGDFTTEVLYERLYLLAADFLVKEKNTAKLISAEATERYDLGKAKPCNQNKALKANFDLETRTSDDSNDQSNLIINLKEYQNPNFSYLDSDSGNHTFNQPPRKRMKPSAESLVPGIRIFDYELLGTLLNPNINHFNIWNLMDWTFYCAKLSTNESTQSVKYHTVYKTYNKVLHLIFDIVAINFDYELVKNVKGYNLTIDTFQQLKDTNSFKIFYHSLDGRHVSTSNVLLLNLLSQLNSSQADLYEMALNYILRGIYYPFNEIPNPCYHVELAFIRQRDFLDLPHITLFSDCIDSFQIRYKIILLMYYYAITFHDNNAVQRSSRLRSYLSLKSLVVELSKRLLQFNFNFLKLFYAISSMREIRVPNFVKSSMMQEVTYTLLYQLTGVNFETGRIDEQSNSQTILEATINTIDLVLDENTYAAIIEDETYANFDDFYRAWRKLNFVLAWLLGMLLTEFRLKCVYENKDIEIFRHKLNLADETRVRMYKSFIQQHSIRNEKFNFLIEEHDREQLLNFSLAAFEELLIFRFNLYTNKS